MCIYSDLIFVSFSNKLLKSFALDNQRIQSCNVLSCGWKYFMFHQMEVFFTIFLVSEYEIICSVLRVELDVEKFIRDPAQQQLEFQEIPNPYLRLIVHRVAQHHHLQSSAIPYGSSYRIILCKTADNYCAPPVRLADVPVNLPQEDSNLMLNVSIKQRPKHSQNISIDTHFSRANYQKSFEERKEEYDRARARIFNSNDSSTRTDSDPQDEVRLPDSLQDSSFAPARSDEKPPSGGSENCPRSCSDSSSSHSLTKIEEEPFVSGHSGSSSGAIFQDYDPDYDRSYDRYILLSNF